MLNAAQLAYMLGEADGIILNLVERLIIDNPADSLEPNNERDVELVELVAEATAFCDVLRESYGLPTLMGVETE